MNRGRSLFRFLLRAYPRAFRNQYEAELIDFFELESRHRRYRARLIGPLLFWIVVITDLVLSASRQRLRTLTGGNANKTSRGELMSMWLADLKYAIRMLLKAPTFALVAVITLALGIGANATIFSAVDVFMLRPLPYPESEELVTFLTTKPDRGWVFTVSPPDYQDVKEGVTSASLAAYQMDGFNFAGDFEPERLAGSWVTTNFFDVLGVDPAVGRSFPRTAGTEGGEKVAIISHELWQRRFGGEPVLGRTTVVNGTTYQVIGVMPPEFWFDEPGVDVWLPLVMSGDESRDSRWLVGFGRLHEGSTLDELRVEMEALAAGMAEAYPETNAGNSFQVRSLHDWIFDEGFRSGSFIASLAVAFVLLIACANVANLILARASGRTREVAVRSALGASRKRILSQLLTESLVIAVIGGVLGIGVAFLGTRGLVAMMPSFFPRLDEIGLDGRLIAYTLGLALVTALIFGVAPALQSSNPNLTESLKEGGRTGSGGALGKLRKVLVVTEVALALVMVISSALLIKGFMNLSGYEYGFRTEGILTFRIELPPEQYEDDDSRVEFQRDLLRRLREVSGVRGAATIHRLPRTGNSSLYYNLPGEEVDPEDRPIVAFRAVSDDYFRVMGVPVIEGRAFSELDLPGSEPVAIVNKKFAEQLWPQGAVGRTIELTRGSQRVVGVVGNTADVGPDVLPMLYLPASQSPVQNTPYLVATTGEPTAFTDRVRQEVAALDPNLPLYQLASLEGFLEERVSTEGVMPRIMSVLGGLALALAVIGVYGVMMYSVSQRMQEIGIRMALGAGRKSVVSLVVRQGLGLTLAGIGFGLVLAFFVSKSLSFFLYGVEPFDVVTYLGVAAVLTVVGVGASWLPALRASRVDPMDTLRNE